MSTNGQLVFTDVDKITFKGVGNASNAVIDTLTGKIGVGIDSPDANLHVVGNSYVSTNLELGGTLIMGTVNVEAQHSLEAVTATGNTTPLTIEFTNPTTSLVASGNVEVGGNVVAGYLYGDGSNITGISSTLQAITDSGNVTSNTVQFSNATTGFVTTANVEVGGELIVSGNATVSSNLTVSGNATVSSNLTVSGNATVSENLTVSGNVVVDTNTLFVDSVNNRVGVGTSTPGQKLSIYTGSTGTAALSFDRYSSDNYRTDIYQNSYGADFRVGYGSYTPESVLYLKRLSNGTKEVEINGNVGIGTDTPGTMLEIYSPNTNSANFKIKGRRTNQSDVFETLWVQKGASGDRAIQQQSTPYSASSDDIHTWLTWNSSNNGWNYPMKLRANGDLIISGSLNPSDDRLKTNEVFLENATETLMKLKPQKYDKHEFSFIEISPEEYSNVVDGNVYIESVNKLFDVNDFNYSPTENIWYKRTLSDDTHKEAGLIAQDIWYDTPELRYLVSVPGDAQIPETKPKTSDDPTIDPDYENWGRTNAAVNYTYLIPYLIKATQELNTELQAEKEKTRALEDKAEALEDHLTRFTVQVTARLAALENNLPS